MYDLQLPLFGISGCSFRSTVRNLCSVWSSKQFETQPAGQLLLLAPVSSSESIGSRFWAVGKKEEVCFSLFLLPGGRRPDYIASSNMISWCPSELAHCARLPC